MYVLSNLNFNCDFYKGMEQHKLLSDDQMLDFAYSHFHNFLLHLFSVGPVCGKRHALTILKGKKRTYQIA